MLTSQEIKDYEDQMKREHSKYSLEDLIDALILSAIEIGHHREKRKGDLSALDNEDDYVRHLARNRVIKQMIIDRDKSKILGNLF